MHANSDIRYSVIVPVYGNAPTIPDVVRRLARVNAKLHGTLECVFVVDGSPDESVDLLRTLLPDAAFTAQLILLSRNFGSFPAIRAGLQAARGSFVAVMAADLQEPPEILEHFFARLCDGECDIVLGRRTGRSDPWTTRASSDLYWRLYRRVVNPEIPEGGVDVFACSRAVVDQINNFREVHTSLVGLLFWLGFRRSFVDYERQPRAEGRSGWTLRRKMRYLLDSVYAFTDLPIIVLQVLGIVGIIGSFIIGLFTLTAWALGAITVPGYTPLILVMLFATSAILLGLGVVGSYLWRTYENGKQRPVTVVREQLLFDRAGLSSEGDRDA